MAKHHKSHLLLISWPPDHCGAPGGRLTVTNRVLSRTGSADRVDPVGRPGFEGENPWKIQNFWCVGSSGAWSHRRMLRDRSVDVLGVRGRLHSASSSVNSKNPGYFAIFPKNPGLGLYPPTSEGSISELRGSQTKSRICRGSYMC